MSLLDIANGTLVKGRYQIVRFLGEGGFARVYKAWDMQLNRAVALKILNFALVLENDSERFGREAKVLAGLQHPSIVTVYSYELTDENYPFLVMEYLEGRTLAQMIAAGPISDAAMFKQIFLPLCQALDYARSKGVIHRDLSPGNILIIENTEGLRVKLIDFGLAKLFGDGAITSTATGQMLGSPAYMSPEASRGARLDQRSDIYSLASVMYECLHGQPPFQANSLISLLNMIQNDLPARPRIEFFDQKKRDNLDRLILACLQKQPEKRPNDWNELITCLEDADFSCSCEAERSWSDQVKGKSANPVMVFATVLTLLFALVFVGISQSGHKRTRQEQSTTVAKRSDNERRQDILRRDIEAIRKRSGENSLELARKYDLLSEQHREEKEFAEEQLTRQKSLDIKKAQLSPYDPELAITYYALGECYLSEAKFSEAEQMVSKTYDIQRRIYGDDSPALFHTLSGLASVQASMHRWADAERSYKKLCQIEEKNVGNDSHGYVHALWLLGSFYYSCNRNAEAIVILEKGLQKACKNNVSRHASYKSAESLDEYVASQIDNSELIADLEVSLAQCHEKKGDWKRAADLLRDALELRERLYKPGDLRRIQCQDQLRNVENHLQGG